MSELWEALAKLIVRLQQAEESLGLSVVDFGQLQGDITKFREVLAAFETRLAAVEDAPKNEEVAPVDTTNHEEQPHQEGG